MFEIIAAVILSSVTVVAVTIGAKRHKRRQVHLLESQFQATREQAAAQGWSVYEGIDLHYAEVAEAIAQRSGLSPPPPMRTQSERAHFSPLATWQFRTIWVRPTAEGELVLVETEQGTLFCSRPTEGVGTLYQYDQHSRSQHTESGVMPSFEPPLDVPALLSWLPTPVFLRIRPQPQEILLAARGWLTPDLAEHLGRCLQTVHDHLPQLPGHGPMR